MGIGLAIGAAVASTAGSAISARKQAKAADKQQKQQISSIADLQRVREGLVAEAEAGTFQGRYGTDDIFGRKPSQFSVRESALRAASDNLATLPAQQNFVEAANRATSADSLRRASEFDPNFQQNVRGLSDSARALINGELPPDVLESIMRNRAEIGATQGVPGSNRAATSRDLGLTSLDLQNQGASLFTQVNSIRDQIDPLSRQIGLNQQFLSPEQQLQIDAANSALRSSADPAAQQLFNLELRGGREEALARGGVSVPVDNTLGAGLSGLGGALSGFAGSGLFGGNQQAKFDSQTGQRL